MTEAAAPTPSASRIGEMDIIRGFALFGVLWMNIYGHAGFLVPADEIHGLTEFKVLEDVMRLLSNLLMNGKAQTLFSLLFGFGFAVMMDRMREQGANGTAIYLRRLTILLVLGIAHTVLLWMGDILNAYAAMGFLLLLTRRWSSRWLLGVGLALALLTPAAVATYYHLTSAGGPPSFAAVFEAGEKVRWLVVMGHDYPAFVVAMFRGLFVDYYAQPIAIIYLGLILGRFLLGSWIFRQGWLQAPERYLKGFAVAAATFLPLGLLLALVRPLMRSLELKPLDWAQPLFRGIGPIAELVIALGYAALIVILCQIPAVRRPLSSLGAVGQMALTNYLVQSLFFFFVLYGFGLGLLPWMGPTLSLVSAVAVFAVQVVFSRWWLARYRFGPAEWLWRWGTYGAKPVLRRAA